MVSVCTEPARGGRLCERFGGYKTIDQKPLSGDKNIYITKGGQGVQQKNLCNA